MNEIKLVQNDLLPKILFEVKLDDEIFNLTDHTVFFSMKNTKDESVKINKGECIVLDAALGTCYYEFEVGETDTAGVFKGELTILDGSGKPSTNYEEFDIIIRKEIS